MCGDCDTDFGRHCKRDSRCAILSCSCAIFLCLGICHLRQTKATTTTTNSTTNSGSSWFLRSESQVFLTIRNLWMKWSWFGSWIIVYLQCQQTAIFSIEISIIKWKIGWKKKRKKTKNAIRKFAARGLSHRKFTYTQCYLPQSANGCVECYPISPIENGSRGRSRENSDGYFRIASERTRNTISAIQFDPDNNKCHSEWEYRAHINTQTLPSIRLENNGALYLLRFIKKANDAHQHKLIKLEGTSVWVLKAAPAIAHIKTKNY